jgi:vinculin
VGEKSLRQVIDYAARVAERALPPDREAIRKLTGDVASMVDALCELRQKGEGATPQAQGLARSIGQKLKELDALVAKAVVNVEKSGLVQPAHTVSGRLDQAKRYLLNPSADDRGLGQQAIGLIVQEGRKVKVATLSSKVLKLP